VRGAAPRAEGLVLLHLPLGLILGGACLWLGLTAGAISFWGFGGACLLSVAPALSLRSRIREGLGNRGLERERLTLKTTSHLLRLLALGLVLASGSALYGDRGPLMGLPALGLAGLALVLLGALWIAKGRVAVEHPALDQDRARARTLAEGAALLLVGSLLGHGFPMADAITGLALALRFFIEARTLALATTVPVACGGCGSGCH